VHHLENTVPKAANVTLHATGAHLFQSTDSHGWNIVRGQGQDLQKVDKNAAACVRV